MKLLLDEQVPARLAREFPEKYDVHTVQKMGWASAKNGELLKLAAADGFVALLSADRKHAVSAIFDGIGNCCNCISASDEQIGRSGAACSGHNCITRR